MSWERGVVAKKVRWQVVEGGERGSRARSNGNTADGRTVGRTGRNRSHTDGECDSPTDEGFYGGGSGVLPGLATVVDFPGLCAFDCW